MSITDRQLQAKVTSAGDRWLSHSFGHGCGTLAARLPGTAAGSSSERTFYFRYVDAKGRRQALKIGVYSGRGGPGGLTLAQAMREAGELSRLHQRGIKNVREHLAAEIAAHTAEAASRTRAATADQHGDSNRVTVRVLFEQWKATELAARLTADGKRSGRKDDGEYVRRLFETRVFPAIGDIEAGAVRKSDIMRILDKARTDGRLRTANVLLQSLKQCFRFALVREMVERNPLDTLSRRDAGGSESSRDRVLSAAELLCLAKALVDSDLTPRSTHAIWLILATAVRIGEAMAARWEHVDLAKRIWLLPETKNQRSHIVHLSDFAVRQFEAIHLLQASRMKRRAKRLKTPLSHLSESRWVFSNAAGDDHIDIRTFGKQLADRQRGPSQTRMNRASSNALSLPGGRWTPHDLRRTAATLMAELGTSGDVIDECLNHQIESKVRRTYIRDRRQADQAIAFDKLGARIDQIVALAGTSRPDGR